MQKIRKVKSSAKILKEDVKWRKFIENMHRQKNETDKITLGAGETNIYNVKLKKTVNLYRDKTKLLENKEKESMVDEHLHLHGDEKKENFKSKLSKLKCLEAGGQTECERKQGPPFTFVNNTTKINLHIQSEKKVKLLTSGTDQDQNSRSLSSTNQ